MLWEAKKFPSSCKLKVKDSLKSLSLYHIFVKLPTAVGKLAEAKVLFESSFMTSRVIENLVSLCSFLLIIVY